MLLAVLVALVGLGALGVVGLTGRMPKFWLAADHGVSASDPEWVRCAAETIERHPEPFRAEHGFVLEHEGAHLVVRSTWIDTGVQVGEGHLVWKPRSAQDFRDIPLDCPGVRP
ncbi:MAG: hypothetical protein FJW79_08100 [Actinobacteria bacterium]|nr:hypothetical protein [Actinomycetota bacterium]